MLGAGWAIRTCSLVEFDNPVQDVAGEQGLRVELGHGAGRADRPETAGQVTAWSRRAARCRGRSARLDFVRWRVGTRQDALR